MPDRETVIKGCEYWIKNHKGEQLILEYTAVEDLLALLKEQDNCENCAMAIEDRQPVVRCKDCKHGKIHGIDVECVAHEEVGYDPEPWHPLDWFCADGEQKETK